MYGNSPKASKGSEEKLVGFYNVFRQEDVSIHKIITEQIHLLESSGLAAASQAINVIFAGTEHQSFRVPTRSSKFVLASSKSSGDEKDTLQLLYNHCVASPRDKVFYIHSKGSFHPSTSNDMLRQNLMKAVVACWQHDGVAHHDVCGLRVSPLPHPHYSGNMWLARCDYIAKLHPPATFGKAMHTITRDAGPKCEPWMVGASRFSQEHWVLSHPSVVASDVLPLPASPEAPVFTWGHKHLPDPGSWTPDLESFPRAGLPFFAFVLKEIAPALACSFKSRRVREYRALYGAGAMAGLPNASIYCQWYPLALAHLEDSRFPMEHPSPIYHSYRADMLAVRDGDCAPSPAAHGRQRL